MKLYGVAVDLSTLPAQSKPAPSSTVISAFAGPHAPLYAPLLSHPAVVSVPPVYGWPAFAPTNVPAPSLTSFIWPVKAMWEFVTVAPPATFTCSSPPPVASVISPLPVVCASVRECPARSIFASMNAGPVTLCSPTFSPSDGPAANAPEPMFIAYSPVTLS